MQQSDKEIECLFYYPGEVQKFLGISATSFYDLVKTDGFPKPRKVGSIKTPMFLRQEIVEWSKNLPLSNFYEKQKEDES